jgi:metallophosphoesterase (TIGR00282 family)
LKILFIGDIVGRPGRQATKALLPRVVERYKIDFVVANGENAAGGFGITADSAGELFSMGVHVITSGNHIWDKKEVLSYIEREDRLIRPFNYPPGSPGAGSVIAALPNGDKVAVLNLSGRVFMGLMDCPFRAAEKEVAALRKKTPVVIVDFHAEATSEKVAMGYFLDGHVSALLGTHTHVQTADERVLPGGTAYITDAGMTGPLDSVIGVKKEQIIDKFLTSMPKRFEIPGGPVVFSAVVVETDEKTGRSSSLSRLQLTYP